MKTVLILDPISSYSYESFNFQVIVMNPLIFKLRFHKHTMTSKEPQGIEKEAKILISGIAHM